MSNAEYFDSLGSSPGYRVVLEEAKLRLEGRELFSPETMVMGWPFRFVSAGKVYGGHTCPTETGAEVPYQRGRDITEQDLDDALRVFHDFGYPVNIDREHRMDEPRGVVLDMWKTFDDEGNPCLACIPAYGPELAEYVYKCDGTLFSSPAIEWASDNGYFVDQGTGDNIGKFRINGLAVCVRPGQAPRKLDRVRLSDDSATDSEVLILPAIKEEIPTDIFTNMLDKTISMVDDSSVSTKDRSESYIGETESMDMEDLKALLEEMLAENKALLEEMLAEKFAILADHLMKIEEKIGGNPEDAAEVAEEEPEEEVGESEQDEMSALMSEVETLREEKYAREAKDVIDQMKLPKSQWGIAEAAWRAEFVDKKAEELGYRPFTDIFKPNDKISTVDKGHSKPIRSKDADYLSLVEEEKRQGKTHGEALSYAMQQYPEAYKAYLDKINHQ